MPLTRPTPDFLLRPREAQFAKENLGLTSPWIPGGKVRPTLVCNEAGAYSGGSTMHWKDGGGVGTRRMTREYYQRRFVTMKEKLKLDTYVEMYVQSFGNWYFRPSWAGSEPYPTSIHSGISQAYWYDNVLPADKPNIEDFDHIEAALEMCDELGMEYWAGLGLWRDDYDLVTHLFRVNVVGDADPMLGGISLPDRLSAAIEFTQRLAQELYTRYGHHPSFAGFKYSQETQHMPSSNAYYTGCYSGGSGTYPKLNTYQAIRTSAHPRGLRLMITPSTLIESYSPGPVTVDITGSTYATEWINSGVDVILLQNNAGNGMDYTVRDLTHVRALEYSYSLADNYQRYVERFQRGVDEANTWLRLKTRKIAAWGLAEIWNMGINPAGTLNLGAGYNGPVGGSVTLTSAGLFADAQVGSIISGLTGSVTGKITLTDVSGKPNTVIGTLNRVFSANTIASTLWSIYNGYGNPYPCTASQYLAEIPHFLTLFEKTGLYAYNHMSDPAEDLQPPESWATRADWGTRARALFTQAKNFAEQNAKRLEETLPTTQIIKRTVFTEGPLSGTAISSTLRSFTPRLPNSFVKITHRAHWYRGAGAAGDITGTLKVNTFSVGSAYIRKGRAGADGGSGLLEFIYERYPPAGATITSNIDLAAAVAMADVFVRTEFEEFVA